MHDELKSKADLGADYLHDELKSEADLMTLLDCGPCSVAASDLSASATPVTGPSRCCDVNDGGGRGAAVVPSVRDSRAPNSVEFRLKTARANPSSGCGGRSAD